MKKIYVAEDNPLQVELIRVMLGTIEDVEADFFSDGLELYQKVQEERPDLLVLDIILPSLSGLAITRLLKFHDDFRDIPILVMSSITDPDIQDRVAAVGANMFIAKPFKMEEFLSYVQLLLSLTDFAGVVEQNPSGETYSPATG